MKNSNGKFVGIVYRYTNNVECSEKGRCYIGATVDPESRQYAWSKSSSYAGYKINLARIHFGIFDWGYMELETIIADTLKELVRKLEEREAYWIQYYDSFHNGYNSNFGGRGNKGVPRSTETCLKISESRKAYFKLNPLTQEVKDKMRLGHLKSSKKVIMLKNGLKRVMDCLTDAAKFLNINPGLVKYYLENGKEYKRLGVSFQYA